MANRLPLEVSLKALGGRLLHLSSPVVLNHLSDLTPSAVPLSDDGCEPGYDGICGYLFEST
jgi:hypothetical protein